MALFKFKSKGKTRQLVDLIYPVGTIYESTSATNPGTLFGGTWETFAPGRVLIGAGQGNDGTTSMSFTSLGTYGEYKHKLTVSEIPNHKHDTPAPQNLAQVTTTDTGFGCFKVEYPRIGGNEGYYTSEVGSSDSHNNIQPSIAVYMWRRTA